MSFLYPGEYIDSTYSIDFDKLYKEGYRGIIFDIDNTLVTHGSPADERAIALFKHLKKNFVCDDGLLEQYWDTLLHKMSTDK